MSRAQAPGAIGLSLKKRFISLSRALLMLHIMHWVTDQNDPYFVPPSVDRAAKAAVQVLSLWERRSIDVRTLKSDWAKAKESVAIAYAAENIRVRFNTSLLDCFKVGKVQRIKPGHISDLISRARYLTNDLLARLKNPDTKTMTSSALPGPAPAATRFLAETFDATEIEEIAKCFANSECVAREAIPAYGSRPEIPLPRKDTMK